MVKVLRLNEKASFVFQYSALVAFVAIALVGMSPYIQRSICGNWRSSADAIGFGRQYLTSPKSFIGPISIPAPVVEAGPTETDNQIPIDHPMPHELPRDYNPTDGIEDTDIIPESEFDRGEFGEYSTGGIINNIGRDTSFQEQEFTGIGSMQIR